MSELVNFLSDVYGAPALVWGVAAVLSLLSAIIVHAYVDNPYISTGAYFTLMIAAMVALIGFDQNGIVFSSDHDGNLVAVASFAICSCALLAILLRRLYNMLLDRRAAQTFKLPSR